MVAQGGELRDVVTVSAFDVDAGRLVAGTEVVNKGPSGHSSGSR